MSTVAARQALTTPIVERGKNLSTIREDQWFERKSSRTPPKALSEVIVGLANAEGGLIVIGIAGGAVEGVDSSVSDQNAWRHAAMDLTIPSVSMRAELIDCINQKGAPDHLMIIEVEPSNQIHATTKDEVFLRVGDETRKLTYDQRRELEFDKGQTNYEMTPMDGIEFVELDDRLLEQYSRAVGHSDAKRLLIARGLMTSESRVTVGAMLLFGKSPQKYFPEAHVRVLRYEGTERGTGRRQRLLSDVRFEGAIPQILVAVREHVAGLIPTRRALGVTGVFERIGLVPQDAWLEGLVNAVVHRSYSIQGDHVRIELFDDRVEVESPGRFPGIVDLHDARAITRFARNPRIARVCSDLNFGQELGEGIRRIFEEMALAGLASPEYRQTSGSTVLTLRSAPYDRSLDARLPDHAKRIITLVREAERVSTGEIVKSTGLSRPVVLQQLKTLQEEGLVEWSGNSPKDPRAYWRAHVE
jgi:ATP-dependent DNA helicase RecG